MMLNEPPEAATYFLNADNFFVGKRYNIVNKYPFGQRIGYRFKEHWLLYDL